MHKFSYRADIDGLRAIAVALVIIYHTFPKLLTGGFVGVDVFFVISGYLITGIIAQQIIEKEFSLRQFYYRRIVRLFPALILVLIGTLFVGQFYLLPSEFMQLGKHVHSGTLFASNFRLLGESGYFDTAAETKPLLHLWSLAIEEQFYIIWPLILIVLIRFFKILTNIKIVILLVSVSFGLCLYYTNISPSKAFYLPFCRFWEIGVGALLALIQYHLKTQGKNFEPSAKLSNYGLCVGIFLILGSAIIYAQPLPFPGWRALMPCLGTLAVILSRRSNISKVLLSGRLIVGLGLLSYPLYLWHWPLLAVGHIIYPIALPTVFIVSVLFITFLLSFFTYSVVEKGVRSLFVRRKGITVLGLILLMLTVGHVGWAVVKKKIPLGEPTQQIKKIIEATSDGWGFPGLGQVEEKLTEHLTTFSQGKGEEIILFFGDSNIQLFQPRVERLFEMNRISNTKVIFVTRHSCPPIFGVDEIGGHGCLQYGKDVEKYVELLTKEKKLKGVVFGAQWPGYIKDDNKIYFSDPTPVQMNGAKNKENILRSFSKTLQFFEKRTDKLYIIFNIPIDTILHPMNVVERKILDGITINRQTVDSQESFISSVPQLFSHFNNDLVSAAKGIDVEFLNPIDSFKVDGKYRAYSADGKPFYRDCCHVRPFFVRERAVFLDSILEKH